MNSIFAFAALATMTAGPSQVTSNFDSATAWKNVERAIRQSYYGRKSRKDEMDKFLTEAGPLASKAKDLEEFSLQVNIMINRFQDSHFEFFNRSDQGFYLFDGIFRGDKGEKMPTIGAIYASKGSEGYTVRFVLNGSQAEKVGLRKGDVISSVNGKPFSPIDSIKDLTGIKANLVWKRKDTTMSGDLIPTTDLPINEFLSASRASARVIEAGGKKFGYYRSWTLLNDAFRGAMHGAIDGKLSQTDGFILDLRDGFGGRIEGFADPFFRPGVMVERKMVDTVLRQPFGYDKPLVVLINDGSRSAKEVLSYILKVSKRATLVGQPTSGDVLGTTPMPMGTYGYIEIPLMELKLDGKTLEDNPVTPDILAPDEFGPKGEDLILEAGIKTLISQMAKG